MSTSSATAVTDTAPRRAVIAALELLLRERGPATVLSGAGCSTGSGIPDYRDRNGEWKQSRPMQHQEFMATAAARPRYWGRSLVGWTRFCRARPNDAHRALVALQAAGWIDTVITQNVDGLHQHAGQRRVIDLHGRLDRVICMTCRRRESRGDFQRRLLDANGGCEDDLPGDDRLASTRADGDVDIDRDFASLEVPGCLACGGILKPDVVFFGDVVPSARVDAAYRAVARSGMLLVVGSSLMVFSGYRFCRRARELGRPLAIVGLGRRRADADADLKIAGDCAGVLEDLAAALGATGAA